MIDESEQFDDHLASSEDETRIGVGMGGSCPSCRAPVGLGQEFCLECGAAIRFSGRQKRKGTGAGGRVAAAAASAAPTRKGFPWLPFVIVLVLVVAGIAVALVDSGGGGDDSKGSKGGATTEPPLPSITNSTPETEADGDTTTVDDCSSVDPLAGTQPTQPTQPNSSGRTDTETAAGSDPGALGGTGETIPELAPSPGLLGDNDPAADPFEGDVPDTQADDGDSTQTVDRDGVPCDGSTATTPTDTTATTPVDTTGTGGLGGLGSTTPTTSTNGSSTPTTPTTTTPTTPTTTSTGAASSTTSWPDKDGWTVVVFGFPEQARANDRAADLQADGFESGVLFSSDYGSLCPGFYVVFSGVFTTKTQAENQEKRLRGKYQGMYVRKITREGTPKGCST